MKFFNREIEKKRPIRPMESNAQALMRELDEKARLFPLTKDKKVITVLYLKETIVTDIPSNIFLPKDILDCLK